MIVTGDEAMPLVVRAVMCAVPLEIAVAVAVAPGPVTVTTDGASLCHVTASVRTVPLLDVTVAVKDWLA
jgi:hypothetical protein